MLTNLATRQSLAMITALGLTLLFSAMSVAADVKIACAHDMSGRCGPDDNAFSYTEDFEGEGVLGYKQHEGDEGHLPATQAGLARLLGKVEIDDRGAGLTGRIADVAAHGNYAYLTAFRSPNCQEGGVHVVHIANPSKPKEVRSAFIPTSPGSYAGEGVKVIEIGDRDVLVHQNETCQAIPGTQRGGISLWDVSEPRQPVPLALHQGDFTNPAGGLDPVPNDSHSFDLWNDENTGRTYAAIIDNEELTDVDILDITDPTAPVLINDTLDLIAATAQASPDGLTSIFSHDMDVVATDDGRYVMTLNYWDGGYVLLDVTDPLDAVVLAQSDYAQLDEERLARGQMISPEGNAHQSEFSPGLDRLIGTDEDFNPFRLTVTPTSGPNAGQAFTASQAGGTPAITEDAAISGPSEFVGLACAAVSAAPDGTTVAVVERGSCSFQQKLDNITAAGYTSGIVLNSIRPDCTARVNMLAASETVPFVFVNRPSGLKLLGLQGVDGQAACTTPIPGNADSADVEIAATFDGWGYVRLFASDIGNGAAGSGSLTDLDTYAVPESQDAAFATGFGDLSVHEVAMDPRGNGLAYISYYAAGLRVVDYSSGEIQEVGAFVDEGGSNFWGVEVHEINGRLYVLASDRDYGLYIFDAPGQRRPPAGTGRR